MFKNKVIIDFNLVDQIKEVREYWNQDTAFARKKRREFLDNAMKVGGVILVSYLIGHMRGIKTGSNYGNVNLTLNSKER